MNSDKSIALIVKEQCIGVYTGHMAAIPNNPTLYSIFSILMMQHYNKNKSDNERFAIVLRFLADSLDGKKENE